MHAAGRCTCSREHDRWQPAAQVCMHACTTGAHPEFRMVAPLLTATPKKIRLEVPVREAAMFATLKPLPTATVMLGMELTDTAASWSAGRLHTARLRHLVGSAQRSSACIHRVGTPDSDLDGAGRVEAELAGDCTVPSAEVQHTTSHLHVGVKQVQTNRLQPPPADSSLWH